MDAAADDIAQGGANFGRGGLGVLAADRGESLGDAVGGGDQEVAGAAGWVDDGKREDPCLGVLAGGRLVEDRLERGVEQRGDQRGGGVVAAGCLALGAGGGVEREGCGAAVERGMQLE